jgi:hypothetical protein
MGLKMQAVQKYNCISFLIPAQLHIQMHIIQGPKSVSNYLFRKIGYGQTVKKGMHQYFCTACI